MMNTPHPIACHLPKKRRRWIGLVAACTWCGKLHTLRREDDMNRSFLVWEPLDGAR